MSNCYVGIYMKYKKKIILIKTLPLSFNDAFVAFCKKNGTVSFVFICLPLLLTYCMVFKVIYGFKNMHDCGLQLREKMKQLSVPFHITVSVI